jgi:predicted RNase H-related nuclease YkuK (DUF458 family)
MIFTDDQIGKIKWKNGDEEILLDNFINRNKKIIKCYVGTDSQPCGPYTKFAISVCVQVNAGIRFVVHTFKFQNYPNFSVEQRLMKEIEISIMVANYLTTRQLLGVIEIHADINCNPKFRSYRCMHSAKGFVEGMGFRYVGKPYSWAASSIADWFTK